MNIMKHSILAAVALLMGMGLVSCSDANEFTDTATDNPSFGTEHPATLASTNWVRGTGIKTNVYGQDIQGFVESLTFVSEDSVQVKMSEPDYVDETATWVDESNNEATPLYEYTYSDVTGKIEILKRITDDKGKVSKSAIFTGVANTGARDIITIDHYGDKPNTTYLVKR